MLQMWRPAPPRPTARYDARTARARPACRQMAAGDRLRVIYDGLSKDPNSLANLDQDLPNYAQAGRVTSGRTATCCAAHGCWPCLAVLPTGSLRSTLAARAPGLQCKSCVSRRLWGMPATGRGCQPQLWESLPCLASAASRPPPIIPRLPAAWCAHLQPAQRVAVVRDVVRQ